MNKCITCGEVFKYDRNGRKASAHYDRFHSPQKKTKDGKIQLNACHQITLIIKGDSTWEQYFRKHKKRNASWMRDGKALQQYENDNNIQFYSCDDGELSFEDFNVSIWQKIMRRIRND